MPTTILRRARRRLLVLATAAVLAAGLAGCGDPSNGEAPSSQALGISIVVGARSNSAAPVWEDISRLIPTTLPAGSRITVVAVDGSPDGDGLYQHDIPAYDYSGDAVDAAEQVRVQVKTTITTARAAASEADTLGAINAAARSIADIPGPRQLIIDDSMLSTCGDLRFTEGQLTMAAEDVAESLKNNRAVEALTGYDLTIIGQGATAPPQDPLNTTDRLRLRAIWEAPLKAAGAQSIAYVDTVLARPPAADLPPVTPVALIPPSPLQPQPPTLPTPEACAVTLTDDQVSFQPDTADYLDPARAEAAITAAAAAISACPGHITLTGTTSSAGTAAGRTDTSTARATTVRTTLARLLMIDPSTITVVGNGTDNPWHIEDRNPDGSLNLELAVRNRTVHITVTP